MSEFFANENGTIQLDNTVGPPDLIYTGHIPFSRLEVSVFLDPKINMSGGKLAHSSVSVQWTPIGCAYTSVSHIFGGGAGVITAASVKCRASGLIPVRETNQSTIGCLGSWVPIAGGAAVPCACTLFVNYAGQNKARGE